MKNFKNTILVFLIIMMIASIVKADWTNVTHEINNVNVNALTATGNYIFAGNDQYVYRSSNNGDNLGHIWVNPNPLEASYHANSTLRVGDRLEFLVDAYDPKGRQILFEIHYGRLNQNNNDGKFTIDITKDLISNPTSFHINVTAKESEYKNEAKFSVFYTVLP